MLNRHVRTVIWLQIGVAIAGFCIGLLWGVNQALSWLLGCGIALAGSTLYAKVAYRKGMLPAPLILRNHFMAELLKMGTALLLFAVVFLFFKQVSVLALFVGYLAAASAYWFGLLVNIGDKS